MSCNAVIAAVSNLSTAYNLVVINIVQVLVQNQYCGGDHCRDAVSLASTACLVGAIVGQVSMGYVGDCLGRSKALQLTMAFSIIGAFASAFAVPLNEDASSIFFFLSITRFVLGVGVGGVYPLSATIAAESATSASSRGRSAALTFSMQGVGNLVVPLIALATIAIFGNPPNLFSGGPSDAGLAWRVALGIGALPGLLLAPFKASETRKATRPRLSSPVPGGVDLPRVAVGQAGMDVAHSDENPAHPPARPPPVQVPTTPLPRPKSALFGRPNHHQQQHDRRPPPRGGAVTLREALGMRSYWGKLLGCAGGWALFDITFYGNQLFQARVLSQIFSANTTSHEPQPVAGDIHANRALQMLVIAAIGLPGYYVSVLLMDRLGRRRIQLQGFVMMGLTYAALGLASSELKHAPGAMLFLYGLTFFFSNFGPNSTTFILPSETFPAHLRSTLNGFCAASGKLGAVLGSALFVPLKTAVGVGGTMLACAVVALLGFAVTLAFVEDRRGQGMEGDEAGRALNDGVDERGQPRQPSDTPSWRA